MCSGTPNCRNQRNDINYNLESYNNQVLSLQEKYVLIAQIRIAFFRFLLWLIYPLVLDSVCIFGNAMIERHQSKRYDSIHLIAHKIINAIIAYFLNP